MKKTKLLNKVIWKFPITQLWQGRLPNPNVNLKFNRHSVGLDARYEFSFDFAGQLAVNFSPVIIQPFLLALAVEVLRSKTYSMILLEASFFFSELSGEGCIFRRHPQGPLTWNASQQCHFTSVVSSPLITAEVGGTAETLYQPVFVSCCCTVDRIQTF